MEKLQALQVAARESGFVQVEERDEGTVVWLRKEIPDAATNTHQRICIDSAANILTVYWMNAAGKIDSKTFRNVLSVQERLPLHAANDKSCNHRAGLGENVGRPGYDVPAR